MPGRPELPQLWPPMDGESGASHGRWGLRSPDAGLGHMPELRVVGEGLHGRAEGPEEARMTSPLCGDELFIDGPVSFECDRLPHNYRDGLRKVHSSTDRTPDGRTYRVTWTESEPADVSCPSCGHCMAHPDDEHEPDCVVGCSVR